MDFIKEYLDYLQNDDDLQKITYEDPEIVSKEILSELINRVIYSLDLSSLNKNLFRYKKNENEILISSDESSEEFNSDDEENETNDLEKSLFRLKPLKTEGEILLEELPPLKEKLSDLKISNSSLHQIGSINKIFNNWIIIESFKNSIALDLDSILFFKNGDAIGRIFDVIGLVSKPFYVIRYSDELGSRNDLCVNTPVYFLPCINNENLTKFVLVSQLKNIKGSDASWEFNNEPPENVKDYSDDEEERKDKSKSRSKRKFKSLC